ncbi:hypothetical protein BaRGS_00031068, partial [Batillaria attramentaria]
MHIEPLLNALGGARGRYQLLQFTLQVLGNFVNSFSTFSVVFIGYQPEYQCGEIHDLSLLESYFPGNMSDGTLAFIYQQCSVDVSLTRDGNVTSRSVPCLAGINFSMPSDTSFLTEWDLVCDKAGLTELSQTLIIVGQAVSGFIFATLCDRYGRKWVYVISASGLLVISIATAFSPDYRFLLVCRVITGAFKQGVGVSYYTLFMELIPMKSRGTASVIDAALFSLGSSFLPLFAYAMQGYSWRYLQLVVAGLSLYSLLMLCVLDESILWLLNNDRVAEVERILIKACRMNGKNINDVMLVLREDVLKSATSDVDKRVPTHGTEDTEVDNGDGMEERPEIVAGDSVIEGKVDKAYSTQYNVLDLFRYKEVVIPLFVTSFIWTSNNLYYYGIMLGSADLSGNRFFNFALLSLVEIPSSIIAYFLLPRINRRTLSLWCQTVASGALLLSVVLVETGGSDISLVLANIFTYIGKFTLNGGYCVLFVFALEVFPTTLRSAGLGFAATVSRLSSMGAPFFSLL